MGGSVVTMFSFFKKLVVLITDISLVIDVLEDPVCYV